MCDPFAGSIVVIHSHTNGQLEYTTIWATLTCNDSIKWTIKIVLLNVISDCRDDFITEERRFLHSHSSNPNKFLLNFSESALQKINH